MVGCSIVGVVLIVFGAAEAEIKGTVSGILIMLVAAMMRTLYIILVKPLEQKYNPVDLSAVIFAVGAVIELPLFIISGPGQVVNLSVTLWLLIIGSSVGILAFGMVLYVYGVGKITVSTVSMYSNVLPVTAVIASFILFS